LLDRPAREADRTRDVSHRWQGPWSGSRPLIWLTFVGFAPQIGRASA